MDLLTEGHELVQYACSCVLSIMGNKLHKPMTSTLQIFFCEAFFED